VRLSQHPSFEAHTVKACPVYRRCAVLSHPSGDRGQLKVPPGEG
jgi:hypothetical protein